MRVFRTSYRDRAGQTKRVKKWYIETRDHLGIIRRFPAFTDKAESIKLGEKIEKLAVCKQINESPGRELAVWLEQIPVKLRQKLVEIGLIDTYRAAAGKPLIKHIEEFKQSLLDKGDTDKQACTVVYRVSRIIKGCGFNTWSDIQPTAVERYLGDLRSGKESLSKKTSNYYLKAVQHFCLWMVH